MTSIIIFSSITIVIIWINAFLRVRLAFFLFQLFLSTILLLAVNLLSLQSFIIVTSILVFLMILFGMPILRAPLISKYLFSWFARILPPMSNTEKEAITAGDVWWEGELFQGKPNWTTMLNCPQVKLNQREKDFINNQVSTLCNMLDEWEISHKLLDLPPKVWTYLKKERFFSLIISKEYGGLEFSPQANSTIIQKIASRNIAAAVTVMVPNSLGPAELLHKYGTKEQQDKYLPKLATGEDLPCFALTGPEAGSDATSIPDSGVVCYDKFKTEDKVLGIRLNWDKRYITLAPVATLLGLAFKLYDPDKLLGDTESLGITLCLVPTNLDGIEIGKRHLALNIPFLVGPTRGKDVFVPLDSIIGGKKMIGRGWKMLVECLSAGRGISLPALSSATIKHCYKTVGAYAAIRTQFKTPIGKFEGIQDPMATIGGYTYLIEATRQFTLSALGQKIEPSIVTAIVKYHTTELARKGALDAMDIHGGKGIVLGKKNYLARMQQSATIGITVEGANILTRSLIIFGQGAIRCHPYLRAEIESISMEDKTEAIKSFDKNFFAHVGYSISNIIRLKTHTLTARKFYSTPDIAKSGEEKLNRYFKQLSHCSLILANFSEVCFITLGSDLKRKERLSARLGDILSYLFMASSVLKYYYDHKLEVKKGSKDLKKDLKKDLAKDLEFVTWCLDFCLYKIGQSFQKFLDNFPNRLLAVGLKILAFPFGINYKYPSDINGSFIANEMMKDSSFRDRLCLHTFTGDQENDALVIMEHAFKKLSTVNPLLKKIKIAQQNGTLPKESFNIDLNKILKIAKEKKILSEVDIKELKLYEQYRKEIISVDELDSSDLNCL